MVESHDWIRLELPYGVVKQLRGGARHSERTAYTDYGREDASKIVSLLDLQMEDPILVDDEEDSDSVEVPEADPEGFIKWVKTEYTPERWSRVYERDGSVTVWSGKYPAFSRFQQDLKPHLNEYGFMIADTRPKVARTINGEMKRVHWVKAEPIANAIRTTAESDTKTMSDTNTDSNDDTDPDYVCPVCNEEYTNRVDNGYRNGWPTKGDDIATVKFEVCTPKNSNDMYVHTEGVSQIMSGDGLAALQESHSNSNDAVEDATETVSVWRLCYVRDNWAWFTTHDLADLSGDDWDNYPYQENGSVPYAPTNPFDDEESYRKLAFDGPLTDPEGVHGFKNNISTNDIVHRKSVPWLQTERLFKSQDDDSEHVNIFAGASICEFEDNVRRAGGSVYYPNERTPGAIEE